MTGLSGKMGPDHFRAGPLSFTAVAERPRRIDKPALAFEKARAPNRLDRQVF
jgi:hypothetical protein